MVAFDDCWLERTGPTTRPPSRSVTARGEEV
jgi:hypothetical protein